MKIIVMGVSGSGKTSLGRSAAAALGAVFIDADDLHPQENLDKMASGQPLNDADRAPWLRRVGHELASHPSAVIACSALKRSYRETFRALVPDVQFLHLEVPRELLLDRLDHRKGHFMPISLLESQLNDLEEPDDDEGAIILDGSRSQADLVQEIRQALGSQGLGAKQP